MYCCPQAQDWLTLLFLPGLGCGLTNRLLHAFGSPADILAAGSAVTSVPGVGHRLKAILSPGPARTEAIERAKRELEQIEARSISLISRHCACYPPLLNEIEDPPVVLYVRGRPEGLAATSIAVVGSRAATNYGLQVAKDFGRRLAQLGMCITSGGAYGVDGAAHRGALDGGGSTVAVLGCGVDVDYPASHGALFAEIADQGAVVSEYPLATRPEGFRFPARNRIISGLSQATVVVEASERSGSLITARLALDQGREVFAVPGRVDSLRSAGCHRLIQQGAHLVQSAADLMLALGFSVAKVPAAFGSEPFCAAELSPEAEALLARLSCYPQDSEELLSLTGLEPAQLQGLLLELELSGCIRQLPGQQYQRMS